MASSVSGKSPGAEVKTDTGAIPNMNSLIPESVLIEKAQSGDRNAQTLLVDRYWDRIFRWLYRLTNDLHAAEDLTQETFLKALAHLKRFKVGTNFTAWLFRIGHNNYANHYRSRNRQVDSLPDDLPDLSENPIETLQKQESLLFLSRVIDQMPVELRGALLLRVEQGLSFREIAQILDLTEETARWRVFRARQKLHQAIEEKGGPDSI